MDQGLASGVAAPRPLLACLIGVAACGAVASFYAHTLLGRPSSELTPIVTATVAAAIAALACFGFLTMRNVRVGTPARHLSVLFMFAAIYLSAVSTLVSLIGRAMSASDWGMVVIQLFTPVMLTFCSVRVALLRTICRIAVLFALADFTVNALTYIGIAKLAQHVGGGSSYGLHYLGLPGNSFAEGIVAFIAIAYVASGVTSARARSAMAGKLLVIGCLFLSEWLIRARIDFGLSVVAVLLMLFENWLRPPMVIVAIATSLILLWTTFHHNPYHTDETLRRDLITAGARDALRHPFIGEGIRYRATTDLNAEYGELHNAGFTESGALDFAIAYGIPATVCLYISAIFALGAKRGRQTLPAVFLACLTGGFVMTGGLGAFLASIMFYLALIICQREEWWLYAFNQD